ncbi:hypothetical protein ACO1O0_000722 [Amphichorda felina]
MPHKLAEEQYPGTVDEKLGCEVGAYVWMKWNCSDVRIPHLYGFGFSDHRCLTDMHASNIFVDEMWNVTCLIDLEWVCALPSEMLAVPYWLTGCKLDEIKDDRLEEFDAVRREFVDGVKAEERKMGTSRSLSPSVSMDSMEEMWDTKGVWFWYCVESVNAMYYLVADHLCPQFGESLFSKVEVQEKIAQLGKYEEDLRRKFCQDEPKGLADSAGSKLEFGIESQ